MFSTCCETPMLSQELGLSQKSRENILDKNSSFFVSIFLILFLTILFSKSFLKHMYMYNLLVCVFVCVQQTSKRLNRSGPIFRGNSQGRFMDHQQRN